MKTFFSAFAQRVWVVLLVALVAGSFLASCSKNDTAAADYSAIDDTLIQQYLAANNITTAVKQPSGIYYVPVVTNANAPLVTVGKVVSMLYTNQLLNGTVFDATSLRNNNPFNFIFGVNRIPAGIEYGLALMHKGDKAVLLIPSGLAYGSSGAGTTVPANAVIRFDVEVTDINPDFTVPDDNTIKKYLADNNITTAQRQASGLYYVPGTVVPTGTPATAGKTVSVLYTGWLINDTTPFDASSLHSNAPFSFVLGKGQVIPGWDEGIALMRKGEKGVLLIPSALGYGSAGVGSTIPSNAVLRFNVEVTDVQ